MKQYTENIPPIAEPQVKISWLSLWKNHWRYTHWLICSMVTTVICSEFYNILLTLYPHFFFNFYLSIGLQSLILTQLMTCFAILSLGLLSGWLFYGAHLAFLSLKMSYQTLTPILKLWKQSPETKQFIDQLLSQEHFLKLSEFLSETKLPQAFQQFLQQGQHSEDIRHIFEILTQLWAIKTPDEKMKRFIIEVIDSLKLDHDVKQQIEKISRLTHLLVKISQISETLFDNAIQDHQKLEPHLSALNRVTEEVDLLSLMIAYPEVLPFYNAFQDLEEVKLGRSYLHVADFCQSLLEPHGWLDEWLKQHYVQEPKQYASLWLLANRQDKLIYLETIMITMDKSGLYSKHLQNFNFCAHLFEAFSLNDLEDASLGDEVTQNLQLLCSETHLVEFCHLLLQLDQAQLLHADVLKKVILLKQFDVINQFLIQNKKPEKAMLLQHLDALINPIEISQQVDQFVLPNPQANQHRRSWRQFFQHMSCRSQIDVLPHAPHHPHSA